MHPLVSIRAPAWGATDFGVDGFAFGVFQFALPRGERRIPVMPSCNLDLFQFALPRGERPRRRMYRVPSPMFQFALPRGERRATSRHRRMKDWFQFALPRGERPAAVAPPRSPDSFNSRSRVGSDAAGARRGAELCVSIRAPAWGATQTGADCSGMARFQFALPRGERHEFAAAVFRLVEVSIRAPAWGATPLDTSVKVRLRVSIRAPAWGATVVQRSFITACAFQFALPRGERLLRL